MIPLRVADQVQPGTFEYTLNHVVDDELDIGLFASRYHNNNPAILLKIVPFACSRSISAGTEIS